MKNKLNLPELESKKYLHILRSWQRFRMVQEIPDRSAIT